MNKNAAEHLYNYVIDIEKRIKQKAKPNEKISVDGYWQQQVLKLCYSNWNVRRMQKMNITPKVFYYRDEQFPAFQIYDEVDNKFLEIDLEQEKLNLMKKQICWIQHTMNTQDEFITHNPDKDFLYYELQPDDTLEMMKDKFQMYKIPDQAFLQQILQKFFEVQKIQTKNKCFTIIGFYINSQFEIVIEYRIKDDVLNQKQTTKRRHLSSIIDTTRQHFKEGYFITLVNQIISQVFVFEEFEFEYQKDIIYEMLQQYRQCKDYFDYYHRIREFDREFMGWKFYSIYPLDLSTNKIFGKYKILIISDVYKLSFINHSNFIASQKAIDNVQLLQDYVQLVMENEKVLKQNRKDKAKSLLIKPEEIVQQEIQKYKSLLNEMLAKQKFDKKIKEIDQKINYLDGWVLQHLLKSSEESEQNQQSIEYENLMKQKSTLEHMQIEFKKVIDKCKNLLINYNSVNSLSQDKYNLEKIYAIAKIEEKRVQQGLPIYVKKSVILDYMKKNQVFLLVGETGSGKSTQLPQYLAEEIIEYGKVLCCQPKALAAKSLAKRVADELGVYYGKMVGYNLGVESNQDDQTKIIFTQDRILLNIMQNDPQLSEYDAIIIDEAHERTVNIDLLCGMLKNLLVKRPDLKLIITSATVDQKTFCDFFRSENMNCPALKVEGRIYPVLIKYYPSQQEYIHAVENIIYSKVLKKISENKYDGGHVLVFLAGVDEINRMIYKMKNYDDYGKVLYFGLHGQLTYTEQSNAMRDYDKDTIKIIFSTRIAETSLTINDVSLVIDIGQDRVQFYDQKRGMQVTQFNYISQSQAQQRAGRAGRTRPGKCYRLYSETDFQIFDKFKVPEILKTNLDLVVLRIKSFHLNIYDFQFLNQPSNAQLYQSECYLIQINALRRYNDIVSITTLGVLMSQLQTEPKHSRILIQAYYKGVLDQVLQIIAMMMNSQHLFTKSNDQDLDITNKLYQIDGSGDMMTYLKIFKDYRQIQGSNQIYKKEWCAKRGLNYKTLKMCDSSYNDIDQAFFFHQQDLNDKQDEYSRDLEMSSKYYNTINANNYEDVNENDAILKCFISSYYPTICIYTGHPQIGYHMISNDSILRVYGTSALSLLNHYPKYIICSDLYQSQYDYCKIAQEVPEDLLRIVVPQEFINRIDNHYQPKYFESKLTQIPLSLMYFLKSKYTNIQGDHNYTQYSYVDLETQSFYLWTLQKKIDLTPDIEDFKQKCREQVIGRFYGFNIMAYFKQGAEVDSIRLDIGQNFTIIQYNNFPYTVDQIKWFLEYQNIEYDRIFEYSSNYRGQKGEIHFKTYNEAKIAQQYFNSLIGDGRFYFVMKQKNIKQRSIIANSEITFFGALCKGSGFVKCQDEQATNNFFAAFAQDATIQGRLVYLKYTEEKEDFRLSNLPFNYDEYQFEKFIRDRCQQFQIQEPISIRLQYQDSDQSESDFLETLQEISKKYLDEPNPFIFLRTHNNKKFIAKITSVRDPLKLNNFRKELNFKSNILGTSQIYIRNEYKLIKLLSTQSLNVVRTQLNIEIDKLQQIHTDLQIFIREGKFLSSSIIITAQTPNVVRTVAEKLTGLINGYRIETNYSYQLIKQLSKFHDLEQDLSFLEEEYQFHVDRIQLSKGNIIVYTRSGKIQKLSQGIIEIIENKLHNTETIKLTNYSLKPLLSHRHNVLEVIQYKFNVGIQFDIPQKQVTFFGMIDQIKKAKDTLFQELNQERNFDSACQICDDNNGQDLFILSLCAHKFCQSCLYKAFIYNPRIPLRCPDLECQEFISLRDLSLIINEYELDKIFNNSFNKFKEKQNYKNCLTPNCQAFFPKEQQFCYCMSCLSNFCSKCDQQAHEGKTCQEAQQDVINSSQISEEELKHLKIKKCPKCHNGVQKNEGCNHIACKQCEIHFCWVCLFSSNVEKDIYDHMIEKSHNQQ